MYFVKFTETAWKQLHKLNKHKAEEYFILIKQSLENNPTERGKFYGKSNINSLLYFEKRIFTDGGLRFFYVVDKGTVTVVNIEYDGQVRVEGISNKQTQDKVAKRLGL